MKTRILTLCLGLLLFAPLASAQDSCLDCHSDADFIVTNKKLYDYFQSWRASIHGLEGVGCVDCHGGNEGSASKSGAHGSNMAVGTRSSQVNFMNIPDTCGRCHGDFLESYQHSSHSKMLRSRKQEAQGPNCVTCHGSLNAKILDIRNVRETCQQCHNSVSGNQPAIPDKAEHLLNDLNAIRGYQKYISRRANPEKALETTKVLETQLGNLALRWHTFDLEAIEADTSTLLAFAAKARDEVRKERMEQRKAEKDGE